jgi:hypothetical protein
VQKKYNKYQVQTRGPVVPVNPHHDRLKSRGQTVLHAFLMSKDHESDIASGKSIAAICRLPNVLPCVTNVVGLIDLVQGVLCLCTFEPSVTGAEAAVRRVAVAEPHFPAFVDQLQALIGYSVQESLLTACCMPCRFYCTVPFRTPRHGVAAD